MDPYFRLLNIPISEPLVAATTEESASPSSQLSLLAAQDLQNTLHKGVFNHNFGLAENPSLPIIGKMFGVLVVKTEADQLGYLSAFSGKLAGSNQHTQFVPPVFDMLTENSFLNLGMAELNALNEQMRILKKMSPELTAEIRALTNCRKQLSQSLQQQIFDNYCFVNYCGKKKSLHQIFKEAHYKNPPAGAGECAAPKLLQYAFLNNLQPLAMTEFWWGQSPKSKTWKHGHFYPSCKEKCGPILGFMLENGSVCTENISF